MERHQEQELNICRRQNKGKIVCIRAVVDAGKFIAQLISATITNIRKTQKQED